MGACQSLDRNRLNSESVTTYFFPQLVFAGAIDTATSTLIFLWFTSESHQQIRSCPEFSAPIVL